MGPRILYELSRRLAALLEEGLEGTRRVPVVLCHPLDPLEAGKDLESNPVAVLYPVRAGPEERLRQGGLTLEPAARGRQADVLRRPDLWVRVRFAFLVAGGTSEDQLTALGSALRAIHEHPTVTLERPRPPGGRREEPGASEDSEPGEALAVPLRIVECPEGWRELGLPEHRLAVFFEATVPIRSRRGEEVDRVLERELELEGGPPAREGAP